MGINVDRQVPNGYDGYPPQAEVPTSARERFANQYLTTKGSTGSEQQADLDYTCLIVCNDLNIVIRASLPESFMHDVSSSYEAPFAQGLLGMVPGIGAVAKTLGLQLTTQALTAQVWQGSTVGQISLPLIFQVENDASTDVLEPLMKLMFLTLPREEQEGGFLEAPGPHFDLAALLKEGLGEAGALKSDIFGDSFQRGQNLGKQAANGAVNAWDAFTGSFSKGNLLDSSREAVSSSFTAAKNSFGRVASRVGSTLVKSIKNNISLYIGRYMYFSSIVITDVQQNHFVQPLLDGNMGRIECTVQFQPFFLPTQRDIAAMYPSASEDLRRQIDSRSSGQGSSQGWVSQG